MAGFLGSGDLFFNRVVGGVSQGWLRFGNATQFQIQENSEIKTRKSRQKASYGQTLNSVAIKGDAEISITLDDLDKDNLALAFLGTVSGVSVTGGSATAEVATAIHDKSLELANRKVSSVVVQDQTDTTTYVLGTDYEIENAAMGFIKVLSTGAITDGQTLHISYDYATVAGNKVAGGTDASIRVALRLDGENLATQQPVIADVYEAELSPQSGVDFLAEDFANLELNGTLNTPSGKTEAYVLETDLAYT